MKIIKVNSFSEIPENFTGIVEWPDGTKSWFKEGKSHREDGPAVEYYDGDKEWYKDGKRHREDGPAYESNSGYKEWHLEGKEYYRINFNNHVILDSYKGKYNLMWYKLLDKDNVFECPDIPGLITK